jgi:hypothetical protein
MNLKDLQEGLKILENYCDMKNEFIFSEHQQCRLCEYQPDNMTEAELKRLEELDFFADENSWSFWC